MAPIDTAALSSGEELAYQKVLIATAGQNQRAIPGAGLPGTGYLRTVADPDAIKQQAAKVNNG